jgi:hypothetical protein
MIAEGWFQANERDAAKLHKRLFIPLSQTYKKRRQPTDYKLKKSHKVIDYKRSV